HVAHLRYVRYDAHHAEALAVCLDDLADRRPLAKKSSPRRLVNDRDEPRAGDIIGAVRSAFKKVELENAPELVIGSFESRFDLLTVDVRVSGANPRIQREVLDARQIAGVGVEQL